MEVPECMTYPPSARRSRGEVAAKIFTPGAVISGYYTKKTKRDQRLCVEHF